MALNLPGTKNMVKKPEVRIFKRQTIGEKFEKVLDFEKIVYPDGEIIWLFNRDRTQKEYANIDQPALFEADELGGAVFIAQTFTVGRTGDNYPFVMNNVDIKVETFGDDQDVTIEIFEVDSNSKPTSPVISTGTLLAADIPALEAFVKVEMKNVELEVSTEYAIVISTSGSLLWYISSSFTQIGSNAWRSADSGSTWATVGGAYMIKVNGY